MSKDHWCIEHSSQRTITELTNFSSVSMKRFLFWFPKEIVLYFFFSTRSKNNTLIIVKNVFQRFQPSKSERERRKKNVWVWFLSSIYIHVFKASYCWQYFSRIIWAHYETCCLIPEVILFTYPKKTGNASGHTVSINNYFLSYLKDIPKSSECLVGIFFFFSVK